MEEEAIKLVVLLIAGLIGLTISIVIYLVINGGLNINFETFLGIVER